MNGHMTLMEVVYWSKWGSL